MSAAARMGRWPDRIDGLCLLALGGFMAALARSRMYWYFLNPKYAPLTLGAGAVILAAGLALLLRPSVSPGAMGMRRLLRQAAIAGFLAVAATGWVQAKHEGDAIAFEAPPQKQARSEPEAPPPGRETIGGVEYLRLNLAELYIMLDKGRKDYPRHFAIRAQVQRGPGLDARGLVLLDRIAVTCCLADSLDLRFFTRGLDDALPGLKSGDWVEVFGSLAPLKKSDYKALHALAPKGEGPSLALENPGFAVTAEHVRRIDPPDFPYLFEFREKEPFAW
jgi:hypothetical protein